MDSLARLANSEPFDPRPQSQVAAALKAEIAKVIVGQESIVERVLVGLIADGHLLLEGLPGLAKTMLFRTLAEAFQAKFQRIQFTPDLLPADIVGTTIYNPQTSQFTVKKGPVFANLLLADEINRAPAKVQSALLEAMEERRVTVGETTFALPEPFLVLATQNPIEQEGTYALPEAQVDRFMMKIVIDYPSREEESLIIDRMTSQTKPQAQAVASAPDLLQLRQLLPKVYVDPKIKNYILDLVFATRRPQDYGLGDLEHLILHGASPRATLALVQAARAKALLQGRGFVSPDDVRAIGFDVLRHRVMPSYEAEAEEMDADALLRQVFEAVKIP